MQYLGGAITKIIYEDGKTHVAGNWLSDDVIQVRPYVVYTIKVEFLRGNFPDGSVDQSASLTLDGLVVGGECKPWTENLDCNFLDCTSHVTLKEIASNTGSIAVSIRYGKKSEYCDCDKNTWKCNTVVTENTNSSLRLHAAARITLFPKTHPSGNFD